MVCLLPKVGIYTISVVKYQLYICITHFLVGRYGIHMENPLKIGALRRKSSIDALLIEKWWIKWIPSGKLT